MSHKTNFEKGSELVGQGRVLAKTSRDNPTLSKKEKLLAGKAAAERLIKGTRLKNQTTDSNN